MRAPIDIHAALTNVRWQQNPTAVLLHVCESRHKYKSFKTKPGYILNAVLMPLDALAHKN